MNQQVSSDTPDWTREAIAPGEWSPGKRLLAAVRAYQRYRRRGGRWGLFLARWCVLRHRFWSVVSGADIPLSCTIGGGLLIPHPNGIVIHPDARIGVNCLILQQVTLGTRAEGGVPTLEGHVDVGAGAKILGPVRVGAHAVVGANAVVLQDVPANAMAVGVPAIIKRRKPHA